jgi:hypothetical protein
MTSTMKARIDGMPLHVDALPLAQGKTRAVMDFPGGPQSSDAATPASAAPCR